MTKPKSFLVTVFTSVLFAFIVTASFGQAPQPVESSLRKHVQYLASDGLEGRRTGEKGATAAAGYVANQFAQFKLKPGVRSPNGKANFLQTFPYVANVALDQTSFFKLSAEKSLDKVVESGRAFMPYGNSVNGEVTASPIAFAGFGIVTPDKSFDDYSGIDAVGRVVVAFHGTPDASNPHSKFGSVNVHLKANLAKERGAKALILIVGSDDFSTDSHARLSYEPSMGETAIPVVFLDRSVGASILGAADLKELAEIEKWLGMKANAPARIQIKLADQPKATVSIKVGLNKQTVDAYNVIGILEGRDSTLKNEAIVIGAHYDHLGRGGRSSLSPNSQSIHYGADDNASGTAAMLELARRFTKEKSNKRTIIFMGFGGEEEGLLGSQFYVNNALWPIEKIAAMINLDMVGRLNENKLTIGGIGTASEWKELVNAKNESAAAKFSLQLNEDGFGPSDHSSFYGKQVPVLFFFTGTHLDYHKPTDTFEKINYDGLNRIADLVFAIADSVDDSQTRPTYRVAQSSGMGARTTFSVSLGTIPSYAETNDGLGIDGVRDGSPAAKAGIKSGDKITKLAGKDVRNISDYMFALGAMKPGEEYEVVVKRATETLTLKIIPAAAKR